MLGNIQLGLCVFTAPLKNNPASRVTPGAPSVLTLRSREKEIAMAGAVRQLRQTDVSGFRSKFPIC